MRCLRTLRIFLSFAILFVAAAQCAAACKPRRQDTIWLIDTRGAGCPDTASGAEPKLKYARYDHHGRWNAAGKADFLATDDVGVPTCFYIHGNQIDVGMAKDMGLTVYSRLVAGAPDDRPFRMVIFTWPTERIRGILQDVRTKAGRSDTAGYHLAWILDQMNPQVNVSLIGYSFGARSITGALHMLGGGRVAGYELKQRVHPTRASVRTVLMAAAVDDDWLFDGRRNDRAMAQTEKMLLVNNSCDRVLKRYRWLYCGGCAVAMGYEGLSVGRLAAEDRGKVAQFDACCDVGKPHFWAPYFESERILARMRPYVFFAETPVRAAQATKPVEHALAAAIGS